MKRGWRRNPLQDALDALKDAALQLKWVTGAGRTPGQQKALDRARQVLEENGQDVRALD
jgi:hypothetical protein